MSTVGPKLNPFNHDLPAENTPLVNVQVDGTWIQVPKGMNVIEVVHRANKFLPHYCYHPKLQVVGNCRMCLFEMGTPKLDAERKPVMGADGKPEIAWMPRPQIGCATQVSEGMGIRTESPLAQECRKAVMEFLLINHPLDCPICDQAGECKLQQFSVEYGSGTSRFVEEKVHKPKHVDLGARIVLDDERCVLCSRCVRFAKDVVQDDVLGFVNRGSYNTLTAHPGKRFDNDYSLNTVDICPVGALTSKDFRFQMRVWFLKETQSICTSCGTGCNVTVASREDTVYRLTPRNNESVNSDWMCDFGRLDFHASQDKRRVTQPHAKAAGESFPVSWEDAFLQLKQRLEGFKPGEVAIIASARQTNEELFLVRKLADQVKAEFVDVVPRAWKGDNFLKANDKNPNSAGAKLAKVSQEGAKLSALKSAIDSGKVKALFLFQESPEEIGIPAETLAKLSLLVVSGIVLDKNVGHFVLPAAGSYEKSGSMINVHGRLQRLAQAVKPPGSSLEDWEILSRLLKAAGSSKAFSSVEEIFSTLAVEAPALSGLTLSKVCHHGAALDLSKV